MRKLLAVFLLATLDLLPALSLAREEATLPGQGLDPTGAVISRVKVLVVWDQEGCQGPKHKHPKKAETIKTSTDEAGKYSLNLALGKYEVIVSFPGYQGACQDVALSAAGATADCKLTLRPMPSVRANTCSETPRTASESRSWCGDAAGAFSAGGKAAEELTVSDGSDGAR